jgi:hypothetical protein
MPTRPSLLHIAIFVAVLLSSAATALAQTPAKSGPPIPPAILAAKTIFISNAGADGGLFPMPFSGDPNRGYFQLFDQLQSLGLYQLVPDPSQADLVMEIHLQAPNGPRNAAKQLGAADPLPFFSLVIYDRKTHYILWTITEPIGWAILQKSHDNNFDEALSRVVDDIHALSQPNAAALYLHPPARAKFMR